MKNSEHPELSCGHLVDYLQSHKESFISEWAAQVRKDSDVPSGGMAKPEMIDHVPNIFNAINQSIRQHCSNTSVKQVQKIATRHTLVRWVQRYDLKAVIREVSLLREEYTKHLYAFECEQRFASDACHLAATTINRILDDIVIDATDTFFKLQVHATEDET